MHFILRAWIALMVMAVTPLAAMAQSTDVFPERTVRIIVGFTPGGPADTIARSIAEQLSSHWGQPVIVENMPGASGAIAASTVSQATDGGYTLLFADSSSFVILPHLRETLPFDPRTDFTPITVVARQAPVLAARAGLPASTIPELIDYATANPGKVSYGTFGVGTWSHIKMEEFGRLAGIEEVHVPYRGAAQVVTDMLGDRVDLFLGAYGLFEAHETAGTIKILGAATADRLAFRPDIPTISESGLDGFVASVWFGLVGPASMPPEVAAKIQQDIASILVRPDYEAGFLASLQLQGGGETPDAFKTIIASEFEDWRKVVEESGVTVTE